MNWEMRKWGNGFFGKWRITVEEWNMSIIWRLVILLFSQQPSQNKIKKIYVFKAVSIAHRSAIFFFILFGTMYNFISLFNKEVKRNKSAFQKFTSWRCLVPVSLKTPSTVKLPNTFSNCNVYYRTAEIQGHGQLCRGGPTRRLSRSADSARLCVRKNTLFACIDDSRLDRVFLILIPFSTK